MIWKIIFYSVIGVLALAIIIVGSVFLYKKVYYPRKFENVHYRDVLKIVTNYDFRLINKFIFKVGENKYAKIDHIIFGDKFMYLIFSRYYAGNIKGNVDDKSFVFINKKGKKMYTENQYDHMKFVINKLCIQTGLDKAQLIGIVLTNNDCVNYVESNSDHLYIIPRKELPRAIKEIEARDVGPFNDEHLQSAVLTLNVMNRKK